jgi:F-type H+-transporting ATPase subunit epsilon
MSIKLLKLKIVTPERLVFEEMVKQVTLPTKEGVIGVLPGHVALVATLASGEVVADLPASGGEGGDPAPFALTGGFVEVKQVDGVTEVAVLADYAKHVGEIEKNIEAARAKAEKLAKEQKNKEDVDFEHFESELERSITRVKIADKWRNKKYRM